MVQLVNILLVIREAHITPDGHLDCGPGGKKGLWA